MFVISTQHTLLSLYAHNGIMTVAFSAAAKDEKESLKNKRKMKNIKTKTNHKQYK